MTAWTAPITLLAVTAPAAAALLARPALERRSARRLGIAATFATLALATAVSLAWYGGGEPTASDRLDPGLLLGRAPLFVVDELNALLLPFAALIFAFVVLVQPATLAIEHALRQVLLAETLTLATFLTSEPFLLAGLWCLAAAGAWLEIRRHEPPAATGARVFAVYALTSCVFVLLGAALLQCDAAACRPAAAVLLAIAVAVRKGVVPLHSWMPEFFAAAPLPLSVLFNAPQIGAWVAVRLVIPHAPIWLVEGLALASLATAVYGAALALVQTEARRLFGWLFLSQSALVLVGLDARTTIAQTGGLSVWMSSGLALAGFGMTIAALEARRGRLSLLRFAGGYEHKPLLAACFLVLGLASVGFPGTLGFVGQEALVHGAVSDHPYLGFGVLLASMLNGITVLRAYGMLFCGRQDPGRVPQPLRVREQIGFATLVAVLVVAGLFPASFVRSRSRAVERLHTASAHHGTPAPSREARRRADGGVEGERRTERTWLSR